MLDSGCLEFGADGLHDRVPVGAIFAIDTNLDEFVSLEESVVDLLEHGRREPIAGDADHRVQVVRCARNARR